MHPAFISGSGSLGASAAIPLVLVTAKGLGEWMKSQDARTRVLVDAAGFRGDAGKTLLLHGAGGAVERVLVGIGEGTDGFVLASVSFLMALHKTTAVLQRRSPPQDGRLFIRMIDRRAGQFTSTSITCTRALASPWAWAPALALE